MKLLSDIEYNDSIVPFEDYVLTKDIDCLKFLVTTGFTKLQWSKINKLELQKDFETCYVVDPAVSELTKKDIFKNIMDKHQLKPEEVLVIGDDIHSEIKAGRELGIETVVYDYAKKHALLSGYNVISNYNKLKEFI